MASKYLKIRTDREIRLAMLRLYWAKRATS